MKEIREACSGRGPRNAGFRSRPGLAVEHLEPRILLSLGADGGQTLPHDAPTAGALQIVEVGPIDGSGKLGATPGEEAATATTGSAPVVPGAQVDDLASFAGGKGQMASAVNPATYRLPEGATSCLVTLRILSPRTQASWSLVVWDGGGREVGSVSVPSGQGGVTFEIESPGRVATGPITLTLAADPAQPGQFDGAYVLVVAEAVPTHTEPAAAAADYTALFYIGMIPNGNATRDVEEPSRPPASPGQGLPAAGAVAVAPPSGSIEPAYPKPTSGGVVRRELTGEAPSEEQAGTETADSEQSEPDRAVAQGDSAELLDLVSARQVVDAPGGLPGTEAAAGRREVLGRRLAEEGRLSHPGSSSGPVVVTASLAAGLIVPNVLILGAPRFRPSRPRWRWFPQRRTSASAPEPEPEPD